MTRVRQRIFVHQAGSYTKATPTPVVTKNSHATYSDYCQDDVGKKTDHPLLIVHYQYAITPVSGERPDQPPGWRQFYSDYVPEIFRQIVPHIFIPGLPSFATQITKIQARTNPSRPYVSLPVLLYELKDLPEMIRDIGRLKLFYANRGKLGIKPTSRFLASQQLSVQMGWAPLLSDLIKLITFTEQVDRRVAELKRLYDSKGLKRRVNLGKVSVANPPVGQTFLSEIVFVSGNYSDSTIVEDWGTIRWRPPPLGKLPRSEAELRKAARAIVFGFHAGAENLWEAIPWSWLIDWFANVGTYLRATNNNHIFVPGAVNFMRQTTTTRRYEPAGAPAWINGGRATVTLVTKERAQGVATVTASLPFLNERQLSILGALAIQRIR